MRPVTALLLPLAALLLSACATVPQRPLYDDLGGEAGVNALVELLLVRISDDARIAQQFATVDIVHLNDKLVEQICHVADGPCGYTGKSMAEAHAQLAISHADFNALVEDLMWAMDQRGVTRSAQNRLLARLAPMRPDIVVP